MDAAKGEYGLVVMQARRFPLPSLDHNPGTSFPRLTATRGFEGNENNEIQRSSVTLSILAS